MAAPLVKREAFITLLFDDSMTELIYFESRTETNQPAEVKVKMPDGNRLAEEDVRRWLGVRFDCRINFKHDIKVVRELYMSD